MSEQPIAVRVASWLDTWAPAPCGKAREIREEQVRVALGEIFDEVERRADAMNGPEAGYYAALAQVRAELCGRKP